MSQSSMSSMHAANQAAARSRGWAMTTARRNARMGAAMGRMMASPQYQARQASLQQVRQQQELRESLRKSVERKLDCEPVPYSNGAAAMLFRANRTDPNGDPQVVFQCHTDLPGSGTPAMAILWTDDGIEWIDFDQTPLQEAMSRGRLFLFPAAIAFSDGEAYAILPAAHHDKGRLWSAGKDWLWSFATAGTYRGHPFVAGRGGLGTFIDPSLRHLFVARPQTFSDQAGHWIWTGSSSLEEENRLVVHAEAMFEPPEARAVKFLLPKIENAPGRVGLACAQRDDRGDPLVVYDTRPRPAARGPAKSPPAPVARKSANPARAAAARESTKPARPPAYRLAEVDGRLHFIAAPNGKTADGAPVFWADATIEAAGQHLFRITGSHEGKTVSFGLGANGRDPQGRPIFVAPAQARVNGAVAVAFPVSAAVPAMEGSIQS